MTRILVVDDDPDCRALIGAMLSQSVHAEVGYAATATEAFEQLGLEGGTQEAPRTDLVLLDINLPHVDGLTACRRITGAPSLGDVPVIMVTANEDELVLEAAFAAGATDYVTKPIRRRELVARIGAALRLQHERASHAVRELALVARTVTLEETRETLERLSTQDALTGIANRRRFNVFFRAEWKRAARDGDTLAVIMADVDFFHAYNQKHGHLGGDECLTLLAATMSRALCRPSDLLARYGGEEFVMVLPQTDVAGAQAVAERVRAAVAELRLPHGAPACGELVSMSFGVAATVPKGEASSDALIATADEALYFAKAGGRDRVCIATPPAHPDATGRLMLTKMREGM